MSLVVQMTGTRSVAVAEEEDPPLGPNQVRLETWFSGISAGTELTTYRGSNPYLNKMWDPQRRLFVEGGPTVDYPMSGWGYEEVGQVVAVGADVTSPVVGDVVYGTWGHRSHAVVPVTAIAGHVLPPQVSPVQGIFVRVGAIALNAVLAANIHLREHVAVFGQGVIGLLATRMAALSGATVTAVDTLPTRLALATSMGAKEIVSASHPGGAAAAIHTLDPAGADVAIELSGNYRALHEAIRSVRPSGRVVAAGFYQGEGIGLRLGEEFHLNQVELISSQIGSVPAALKARWDRDRLERVFVGLLADRTLELSPLVSHVFAVADVAEAFELLDERPAEALQVVLQFPAARPAVPQQLGPQLSGRQELAS
jgi:2-desacetyl-2-hydroxyethyl bacteriochlorophyllide A dehydrogenase